jgi:asparagine synthase (glutamine-hydrolysing)
MCGITGWGGPLPLDKHALRRMTAAIRHRGPDDDGFHVEPGRAGLGFRRLSIIDVAGGAQPLYNEDRTVAVTCNGEIYNFQDLREELRGRGHLFHTRSDVEVIPHLYEELGIDFLHELQGMFALALWDVREQRLLLACDRMGVKPLYWTEAAGGIVYGSEPGAVLASGLLTARPDPAAIMQYLTMQYVPAPLTAYEGMQKLAPAQRVVWQSGATTVDSWWNLPADERDDDPDDEQVLHELDELLRDATRGRLIADVPLGAFLSGGVDSSLVVAYMAEASSKVKTFSIDVPMTGYSETGHARRVAELFSTDHHEYVVESSMVPALADAVRASGEPFADASAIPTYLISQVTRPAVTVALSGDGGDEAFGGYHRFLRAVQLDRLERFSPLAGLALKVLPGRVLERAPAFKRGLSRATETPHDRYASMAAQFSPRLLDTLCTPDFKRAAGGTRVAWDHVLELPQGRGINRYARLDTITYLPGDILVKVDRMSMAHGLEVRAPLLDYRIQEYAARLPGRFKLRRNVTKWALKELALRRGIPESAVHRQKMGFSIPVGTWFRTSLRSWVTDLLESPEARSRGYFDQAAVSRLVEAHMHSSDERGTHLWNLAMLELWHRTWIDPH